MGKHRKRWTSSEKLEVLHYEKLHGSTKASREYGVSVTSILKWKKAYESSGESGLENVRRSTEESRAMKELLRENAMLKKLVANKELTIMIQKEMIKKSH